MDKTHVPYPGCYCADCVEGAKPIGYIIPEMLNRKSEFEANGIVLHSRPSGMATMPVYAEPPSARITGDKDRENPVEGAPLEATTRHLAIECHRLRSALRWLADTGYVDHQSGNQNFEHLQSIARDALVDAFGDAGSHAVRVHATTLEALDKAEAELREYREAQAFDEARADKAEAERDALREKVDTLFDAIAHGDDDHREWLATAIDRHFRTPIQPEPDPFAVAIAEANESYLAGTGDLADHIREALARHGLAVKEVG